MMTSEIKKKSNDIVSIRIPMVMFERLQKKSKNDLYLDVSEAIRDRVRMRYVQNLQQPAPQPTRTKITEQKLEMIKRILEDGQL